MKKAGVQSVLDRLASFTDVDRLSPVQVPGEGDAWYLEDTRLKSLTEHTEDFGFQWTELYDDYRHDRYKHFEQFLRLGIRPEDLAGKRVLDAGMGLGRLSELLVNEADLVVGCDLSEAVHTAARYVTSANFIPVRSSIADLPFKDHAFDFIMSWGVVHHTPEPEQTMDELWRLLRPGGQLAVWVYEDSKAYRRRSLLNWYLKDLDREEMFETADAVTQLVHVCKMTSPYALNLLLAGLAISIKSSKEYTRHILYDGLGPDFHYLLGTGWFEALGRKWQAQPQFRENPALTAVFTKPA